MSTLRDKRHLADILKKELGFYRSLFVLIDRQKDNLQADADRRLTDDLSGALSVQKRIEESEELIARARQDQDCAFDDWARTPEIESLMTQISEMAETCHEAARDCERLAHDRMAAYKAELARMDGGRRLFATMGTRDSAPQFIDSRP
jgi:hypothetical protein